MHNHVADDDNLFFGSVTITTLTFHSLYPYRGRAQEFTPQENAGNGHCKHTHEPSLLPDKQQESTAHMMYCSKTYVDAPYLQLFLNIVSKFKGQLIDSQIYGLN